MIVGFTSKESVISLGTKYYWKQPVSNNKTRVDNVCLIYGEVTGVNGNCLEDGADVGLK